MGFIRNKPGPEEDSGSLNKVNLLYAPLGSEETTKVLIADHQKKGALMKELVSVFLRSESGGEDRTEHIPADVPV